MFARWACTDRSRDIGYRFETIRFGLTLALVAISIALWSPPARAQQSPDMEAAAQHHEQGISHFQANRYQEAIRAFEAAERLAHSRANLMNLARCHQQLGDNSRAVRYLDRYLAEPGLPADARQRAEQLRGELGGGGGTSLAGPWVILGSGLALILTGGILDIAAYVRSDPDQSFDTYDQYDDWRSSSVSIAVAGDVLMGIGAAAAIGGLIWLLVARRSGSNQASATRYFSLSPTRRGAMLQTEFRF